MTSFLAQCPDCMTSFRVSEPQVAAAGGMVRCGACLGVFSAPANRITIRQAMSPEQIEAGLAAAIAADDEETHANAPAPSSPDNAFEVDYKITLSYGSTTLPAPPFSPQTLPVPMVAAPLQLAVKDRPRHRPPDTGQSAKDIVEPAWLSDGSEPDIRLGDMDLASDATADYFADIRMPGNLAAEPDIENADESVRVKADIAAGFASPSFSAVPAMQADHSDAIDAGNRDRCRGDGEADEVGDRASRNKTRGTNDTAEHLVPSYQTATVGGSKGRGLNDTDARQVAASGTVKDSASRPVVDKDKEALREYLAALEDEEALEPLEYVDLDAINPEPVTIRTAQTVRRQLLRVSAVCLSLLLVLQLGLVLVDRNLDTLLLEPRFTPFIPAVCSVLECPIPEPRSDLSSLYSQDLLIRSHPRYSSALEVSFIFRNDAVTPQPFPAIELGFSDTTNRVLINRLFQPDEYLPAELRDLPEMPPQSSLQILLELADPGSNAVNYTLAFRES